MLALHAGQALADAPGGRGGASRARRASRPARSTSAPRRRPASTCCRTRSAASAATTRTSSSRSRSHPPARSSTGCSPDASSSRSSARPTADERVELDPFLGDEIVGVARPGSLPLRRRTAKPEALAEQTLLVREAGSSTRRVGERALAERARRPRAPGSSTRARRSSAPLAKGSASPSSPATPSPRRSSAASWKLPDRATPLERTLSRRPPGPPTALPSERGFSQPLRAAAPRAKYAAACVA